MAEYGLAAAHGNPVGVFPKGFLDRHDFQPVVQRRRRRVGVDIIDAFGKDPASSSAQRIAVGHTCGFGRARYTRSVRRGRMSQQFAVERCPTHQGMVQAFEDDRAGAFADTVPLWRSNGRQACWGSSLRKERALMRAKAPIEANSISPDPGRYDQVGGPWRINSAFRWRWLASRWRKRQPRY